MLQREEGDWDLEIVDRDWEAESFEVIPKRWIVERTFSWIGRNRRMSKDYEQRVQTSECLMKVATAGCTLPWSNGQTEGHIARLKAIKRSMYGRARFDLLRLRVLYAA